MRLDREHRMWRMIPGVKVTNTSASARTYGSGGHGTLGVVDTQGYDRVRLEIGRNIGTASKIKSVKLFFQSGAATLCASAYNASGSLSGYTSGSIFASTAASGSTRAYDINLMAFGTKRKRYLNALVTTSTTSNAIEIRAYAYRGTSFPPSTTGYASFTAIG